MMQASIYKGHYPQRSWKKRPDADWNQAKNCEDRNEVIKELIGNQIDEEITTEFEKMRGMKQFEKLSDKDLWANVMINHVQRVKKVMNQMKGQGRLNEVNSYEGIERMLGIKVTESPLQKSQSTFKTKMLSNQTLDIVNRQSKFQITTSRDQLKSFGVVSRNDFLNTI